MKPPSPFSITSNEFGNRHSNPQDIMADHRSRVQREAEEREQRRLQQLTEQRSSDRSSSARIRAWEKAHGLRLPASPTHPVLKVIAFATALSLLDVQEEQRARRSSVNEVIA